MGAAERLWDLLLAGKTISDLPEGEKPGDRAAGYAAQAGYDAVGPRAGWKIAATSAAGQAHINVDGPLAGRIPATRMHGADATIPIRVGGMQVVEPEFAFRFGADLPPRVTPYDMAEVMEAVATLHLSLELPDSRFDDFTAVGGPTLIADNACARDLVLGEAVSADWRALDLASHPVQARVEGRFEREGSGAAVLGDPRVALTWIANELSALGIGLKAGEFVTTGTCMVPLEVELGDVVEADYGPLGRIGVRIAAR